MMNTKEIKPGMLVEWRTLDPYTGKIVARKRARVIEEIEPGNWYIHTFGVGSGGGWSSSELHPMN